MNEIKITKEQYLNAKDIVINYRNQILSDLKDCNKILYEFDTPIHNLGFGRRVYNGLVKAGCNTLMDVITVSHLKMRMAKDWGKKSEHELIEFKSKYSIN